MPIKISEETNAHIIEMYKSEHPVAIVAQTLGLSRPHVYKVLKKSGFKFDPAGRSYELNKDFFYSETPESAYFYGFCLADGCLSITPKSSSIAIKISTKDECILDTFSKWISDGTCPIYRYDGGTCGMSALHITCKEICEDKYLQRWGLVPNKTYNPVAPCFAPKLLPYFIIGLIDGDGTISWQPMKKCITLYNNKTISDWYVRSLRTIGFNGLITSHKNGLTIQTRVRRWQDILSLSKILEIENCHFLLNRKWQPLKQALSENYKPSFGAQGIKNASSILKNEDVIKIRKLLQQGFKQKEIGQLFGVSNYAICDIKRGKTWKHIK